MQQLTIKTLLVDDEELALDLIEHLLKDDPRIEIVGKAQSVSSAHDILAQQKVDLLLLDIQMPGENGIEFFATLAKPRPLAVFVTAYDHHAVTAFEEYAVDYLLKPTSKERIKKAIDRVAERLSLGQGADNLNAAVESLMPSVQSPQKMDKLTVKDAGEIYFIDYKGIIWIEAAGDYMCVYTKDKRHILRATMKKLEEELPNDQFIRVHRSKLVNIQHVVQATVLPKGESLLTMTDESKVKVSRNYRQYLSPFMQSK